MASSPDHLQAMTKAVETGAGNTTVGTVPNELVNFADPLHPMGSVLFKAMYV